MLNQIQHIKFAEMFEKFGTSVGGRDWKTNFYRLAFQDTSEHAIAFLGLEKKAAATLMDTLDEEYRFWRKQNEKEATARNRLWEMYKMVTSFGLHRQSLSLPFSLGLFFFLTRSGMFGISTASAQLCLPAFLDLSRAR